MQRENGDNLEGQEPVKRGANDNSGETSTKRARRETALVERNTPSTALIQRQGEQTRTSNLAAPNMLLTGHEGAVYSLSFDPTGQHIASSSFDKTILLWDVYGDCRNYNVLEGHKNAVIQIKWTQNNHIISASADKTVGVWDANRGRRISRFTEHESIVNTCASAKDTPDIFISGSDDCSVIQWDVRQKQSSLVIPHSYQVTACAISDDGQSIFSGGIDNIIRKFDVRKAGQEVLSLRGHEDTVTGLCVSPEGSHLLSNAMDHSLRSWDIRAFVTSEDQRCEKIFQGARHGAEKNLLRCSWSPTGDKVSAGSSDRIVHVWDYASTQQLYYLPGHNGSVNEVIFHPTEPIIASCGSDKQIFLGEIA